jgi:voltage-gated potassium channel
VLNWAIWLAFLTELVVMLAVVPNRRAWLRGHPVEVIVVLLTPPLRAQLDRVEVAVLRSRRRE